MGNQDAVIQKCREMLAIIGLTYSEYTEMNEICQQMPAPTTRKGRADDTRLTTARSLPSRKDES